MTRSITIYLLLDFLLQIDLFQTEMKAKKGK